MSNAEQSMDRVATRQGWNTHTQLELALRYIETQDSPEAFEDFLNDCADAENDRDES